MTNAHKNERIGAQQNTKKIVIKKQMQPTNLIVSSRLIWETKCCFFCTKENTKVIMLMFSRFAGNRRCSRITVATQTHSQRKTQVPHWILFCVRFRFKLHTFDGVFFCSNVFVVLLIGHYKYIDNLCFVCFTIDCHMKQKSKSKSCCCCWKYMSNKRRERITWDIRKLHYIREIKILWTHTREHMHTQTHTPTRCCSNKGTRRETMRWIIGTRANIASVTLVKGSSFRAWNNNNLNNLMATMTEMLCQFERTTENHGK